MTDAPAYPVTSRARNAFVLSRRPPGRRNDPWRHQGVLVEDERAADGRVVRAATVFLTGRECPWRCVMCDLWTFTTAADTPSGALVAQLQDARAALGRPLPDCVKLYNAGSFFDPRAVPEADYGPMAGALGGFSHVVVESHPLLIGRRVVEWQEALRRSAPDGGAASLEVAMGLETANPVALEHLNKRFTRDDFSRAAERLRAAGVALRVFLLVGVPFLTRAEEAEWLPKSVSFAFDCGASAVSLIPTRSGNGAIDELHRLGMFVPPSLGELEDAFDRVLPDARGRVFADVWDLGRFAACPVCLDARRERLRTMNLTQLGAARVPCAACE